MVILMGFYGDFNGDLNGDFNGDFMVILWWF